MTSSTVVSSDHATVSVLVLNQGRPSLDACFASLETQTYPAHRFEVVLVDRGSTDDSIGFVREKFPRTRVLALKGGIGVCAAYNAAVRSCDSQYVALLSGDLCVNSEWLSELVAVAARHRAVSVASTILDEAASGAAAGRLDEAPVLCADTRAALYLRSTFLEAGGFDEDFVEFSEDVDLGWRLSICGGAVVLAPGAVARHRSQNAPSRWTTVQRLRLQERNALATLYKNSDAGTLERRLPVALALVLMRAFSRSGIDTLALPMAVQPPSAVDVSSELVARLIALEDFSRRLPSLTTKRREIQSRRRRPDPDIASVPVDALALEQLPREGRELAQALVHDLGAAEIPGTTVGSSGARAEARPQQTVQQTPTVSIVILTALGPTHLGECLTSLRLQTYPADRIEVIVVDNGSAEDPTAEAQRFYPGVRVVRQAANIGFAGGNNAGAAVATGEYLVFLNDDTRVQPSWLAELVAAARRRGASVVASCILDWSGRRVDFIEGAVNFQGKGFQLEYDAPIDGLRLTEKPLLFACGCAMLVDREAFFEAGQWDEGAFAYYEDLELGWRLNLLGHAVWFAPGAVCYHKHHGTSGRWPEPPRLRLYERNALRMIYRLLEPASLRQVLPAAVLLAVKKALLLADFDCATDPAEVRRPAFRLPRLSTFTTSIKTALRRRGVTRGMSVSEALKRLGVKGLAGSARDVIVPPRRRTNARRLNYRVDRAPAVSAEVTSETLPIDAAAVLAGVHGFLSDLARLSEDRAVIQSRRRASDREVLSRFREHWLNPGPMPFQGEYNAAYVSLVREFGIDTLGLAQPGAASDGAGGAAASGRRLAQD